MVRLLVFASIFALVGCHPSHRELLEKADSDLINQRALLAKYLYLQVAKEHTKCDEIRYRALKGLVEVSLTQNYEYPVAAGAMEKLISEFENDPQFRGEIPEWRRRLAEVWRVNLQNPRQARHALEPLFTRPDLTDKTAQEIGLTLSQLSEFAEAETFFLKAWSGASEKKSCVLLRALQLNLIQNFSVARKCDQALVWAEKALPEGCEPDRFAVALEKANCLEISGDTNAAMKVYENLIKENPKNMRAQFLLENVKRREREKKGK